MTSLLILLTILGAPLANSQTDECRLWLAPSHLSTEQNPKLGLFAGAGFDENETIPYPEVALPLVDFLEAPNRETEQNQKILEEFESSLWTGDFAGAKWEGNYSTTIFVPGAGVLSNYHSGIANIDWVQGSVLLRGREEITKIGKAHPARGAISNYHNMTMKATRRIPPGMELFANFGEVWDGKKSFDIFQEKVSRWDYDDADSVVKEIHAFMEKYADQMNDTFKNDMLDFMLDSILDNTAGKRAKIIKSLIPDRPDKIKHVVEAGGTFHYRFPDMIKSNSWLQEHGQCLDTIKPGKSTIEDAGRGVFARRSIPEDGVIVPVPMIPLANEELLNMYTIVESINENGMVQLTYDRSSSLGQQMFINYCFGHPESSLLLIPAAPLVTLINHAPYHEGAQPQANAYLRWSMHDYVRNDHSLHDMTVEQIAALKDPLITMELVALRDISEDEEIFIDYGENWAAAWGQYKKEWETRHSDGYWPLKAEDVPTIYKNEPYPVNIQKDKSPYPPGVATTCFMLYTEPEDGTPRSNDRGMDIMKWVGPDRFEDFKGNLMTICDLIDFEKDGDSYKYKALVRPTGLDQIIEVNGIPHSAVRLVDKPYQSDMHHVGAFRHYISLRDQSWPQAWRNLRE